MDDTTGVMAEERDGASGPPDRGLVLAYAPRAAALPRALVFTRRTHTIGRAPPPGGFPLKVEAVSRLHLRVDCDGPDVRVRDLGSRNGTFVNGRRVEEAALAGGDVVRIGDAFFVYVDRDASEHARFPLNGDPLPAAPRVEGLVGGLSMARVAREIEMVAPSSAAVLVLGETGTGKELVARAVHARSGRRGPFVPVNCAALPSSLVESELFGHVRGAFTGAGADHPGLFRMAEGGTLFLDEIGDLPAEAQAKLLRVMETREVRPVGASAAVLVDVRVVSATHRDLAAMVAAGSFRADLYARLFGHLVPLPALRSRREDLYGLALAILARAGGREVELGPAVMARVLEHDWPFNVRELQSVLGRALSRASAGVLSVADFPAPPRSREEAPAAAPEARPKRPSPDADTLARLMRENRGNVSAVARALERDPALVYRWLKQHRLDPEAFRS